MVLVLSHNFTNRYLINQKLGTNTPALDSTLNLIHTFSPSHKNFSTHGTGRSTSQARPKHFVTANSSLRNLI
jgi:hypothetical protein